MFNNVNLPNCQTRSTYFLNVAQINKSKFQILPQKTSYRSNFTIIEAISVFNTKGQRHAKGPKRLGNQDWGLFRHIPHYSSLCLKVISVLLNLTAAPKVTLFNQKKQKFLFHFTLFYFFLRGWGGEGVKWQILCFIQFVIEYKKGKFQNNYAN